MAGDTTTTVSRSLENTPTWAVAAVCFVLVLVSLIIEEIIHLIGKWLMRKQKRGLYEALEKIKSELMLLGFISLLLTVLQTSISKICVSEKAGNSWSPCSTTVEVSTTTKLGVVSGDHSRRLLSFLDSDEGFRRILAATTGESCATGKVALISYEAIHQLHVFIFVLAVFHVIHCITTMALGRMKMKSWKKWEKETQTAEYQFSHDPDRFRFARDTSFGRRHLNFWSEKPILLWIFCFFRQFFRSVTKVDYLTLRHGFIMAHLAPQSQNNFNFQKYINRSLEEDFKVVVGISPIIWFFAVVFLLFNTHGWYSYLWLPFIPLVILLLVGTKLQVIITKMGLKIQDRAEVVKGTPVVEPGDDLFWFNRPRLVLYLIHFVLFQNAFQLAFLTYTWIQFEGKKSCFHKYNEAIIIRIATGVVIQFLCSYVTLPLYALVTQMGTSMKPTIFNDRVATALKQWHHTAKKQIKHNKGSVTGTTPESSRPASPSHGTSPVHLMQNYRGMRSDEYPTSPRFKNADATPEIWNVKDSPPADNEINDDSSSSHLPLQQQKLVHRGSVVGAEVYERDDQSGEPQRSPARSIRTGQHEIDMGSLEFSFAKRSRT
ncbi:MLO-like protein 6 [Macadamia integrifolia]|uniref:MLO-like protein 6 n=1 Tax=Macadamia integrifolia TaxID=60698 RepID=UPI001C532F48|nr:MLO-like protein 6 [Macadamia integrifolia]